ncbi:peptidoglycan recognition protein family protein [Nocardia amikacinitolerans]|uniref:peptidoglycan recognition protein family protein n=1 Tax=Nocardia amikacinitolerans TaxID=756689 RepID=UPI001FEBBA9D|nr:N-acetylmuramoyl-L-alanine amidase [Nocardia amikacinitolerans]
MKVVEHDGWLGRGHGDFADIRGVICHHTAGGGANDWSIVQNGRSDLPGPLAQLVLERDGTYRVIAAGVCWHAGRGAWSGWPTNNANFHTIGIEAVNNGRGQEWPAVQLDAYKRGCAAILRHIGRTSDDCVGHKEYSSEGKIDPFGIDMDAFRRDVQEIIDNGGSEMPALQETFTNYKGQTVKLETAVYHLDKYVNEIREQLGGPVPFKGWKQLGDKTVVDSLADAHRKLDTLADAVKILAEKLPTEPKAA